MLCNSEDEREIRFDFFIARDDGKHKLIGSESTTLGELKNGKNQFNVASQTVRITRFETKPIVNFLEYVFGGCQINLHVAIDFTASNGYPSERDSLHN